MTFKEMEESGLRKDVCENTQNKERPYAIPNGLLMPVGFIDYLYERGELVLNTYVACVYK